MNDGARYSIRSPILSNPPPTRPTLAPPLTYDRLNYQNILTSQLEYLQAAINGEETTRVAYTQSGQPTAAVIRDNHAIVDRKLYQTIVARRMRVTTF